MSFSWSCSGDNCVAQAPSTDTVKAYGENFGLKAAEANNSGFQLWAAAAGLILAAIGAKKQYDMYEQMGDLAEAQQKLVESQRERYETITDSIFIPNMTQARANLWGYGLPYAKSITAKVVECATRMCDYTRRKTNNSAAAANVARVMSGARRTARRLTNPRALGVCCDNDTRLTAAQAQLLVGQLAVAERYEDEVEFKWTQFYSNRMIAGGQMAQRMGELSANLAQGAAVQLSGVLGGLNNALEIGQRGVQAQSAGLAGQASVFGGLGSLGGVISGNALGAMSGNNVLRIVFDRNGTGSGVGIGTGDFNNILQGMQTDARASSFDLAKPGELF